MSRSVYQRYTWKQVLAVCEKHGIEVTEGITRYIRTGRKIHGGRIYVNQPKCHEGLEFIFTKDGQTVTWLRCQSENPYYLPFRYLMQDLNRSLDSSIEYHLHRALS